MLKYRLKSPLDSTKFVTVQLNTTDKNGVAQLIYEGDPDAVKEIEAILSSQYGAFGHSIGTWTTPIDLHCAMHKEALALFDPTLIAGETIVDSYDPGIPDNAVT